MLRFDPTRAEHTKFVEAKKRKAPKVKDDRNIKRFKDDYDAEDNNEPEVSTEQFFKVSERLKTSIGQSTGFSLMQMFGRSDTNNATSDHALKQSRYEEIPIAQNIAKGLANLIPFNYDSSDEEDDERKVGTKQKSKVSSTVASKKIWHEPFFMLISNDARYTGKISITYNRVSCVVFLMRFW